MLFWSKSARNSTSAEELEVLFCQGPTHLIFLSLSQPHQLSQADQTPSGGGRWEAWCFSSFDLSRYHHLLPVVRCSAVTAPQETHGQTDAGFLRSADEPSAGLRRPLCLGCTGGRWQRMEGEREEQMTISWEKGREGKEGVRHRKEWRETEKDGKSCHGSLTHSHCSGFRTELRGTKLMYDSRGTITALQTRISLIIWEREWTDSTPSGVSTVFSSLWIPQ